MTVPIAIVVLTKDEPGFLEKTIRSIINRTSHPYELFIVDNNSSLDKQKKLLKSYEKDGLAHMIFNNKNQWVLGFNKAMDVINTRADLSSEYIVLTDGDIVVPNSVNEVCWLTYLKQKMDGNVTVGKLGLALDLSFIKSKKEFTKTYAEHLEYMRGPVVDGLIIAPVDTTLAIYRKNLFVMDKFKMLPGHASLVKPYYYICKTSFTYQAEHLGWRNYEKPNKKQMEDKVICFTKYAGYVDPVILDKTSVEIRYFYKVFRHVYRAYWLLRVIFYWSLYIAPKFPRNLNEIQSRRR